MLLLNCPYCGIAAEETEFAPGVRSRPGRRNPTRFVADGGIAGLRAAQVAARAGARAIVMEQSAHWGGRAPVDRVGIDGEPADAWIAQTLAELGASPNEQLRLPWTWPSVWRLWPDRAVPRASLPPTSAAPGVDAPRFSTLIPRQAKPHGKEPRWLSNFPIFPMPMMRSPVWA